jgi:hypothetical protein
MKGIVEGVYLISSFILPNLPISCSLPYFIIMHYCFDAIKLLTGMVNTGAAVLGSAELAMLTDQNRRIDLKNSFVGWSVLSIIRCLSIRPPASAVRAKLNIHELCESIQVHNR